MQIRTCQFLYKNKHFAITIVYVLCSFSSIHAYQNNEVTIFNSLNEIDIDNLDSVKIHKLYRTGMESYDLSFNSYKLSPEEINKLINFIKDTTNFSVCTPLYFGYTSAIYFYKGSHSNSLKLAPICFKIMAEDFDIPHNRTYEIEESGGAVAFPKINQKMADFLLSLEEKCHSDDQNGK